MEQLFRIIFRIILVSLAFIVTTFFSVVFFVFALLGSVVALVVALFKDDDEHKYKKLHRNDNRGKHKFADVIDVDATYIVNESDDTGIKSFGDNYKSTTNKS